MRRFQADHTPPHDDDYMMILNKAASMYDLNGEFDLALPLYQRALESYEKRLGKTHPSTLSTLNNLAGCLDSMGQYDQVTEVVLARGLSCLHRVNEAVVRWDCGVPVGRLAIRSS